MLGIFKKQHWYLTVVKAVVVSKEGDKETAISSVHYFKHRLIPEEMKFDEMVAEVLNKDGKSGKIVDLQILWSWRL